MLSTLMAELYASEKANLTTNLEAAPLMGTEYLKEFQVPGFPNLSSSRLTTSALAPVFASSILITNVGLLAALVAAVLSLTSVLVLAMVFI